jgi:peptidoglycan/LPS O-acetylase OafA/YrhL
MKYIPGLDGLRAVAILAVLLFHLFPRTFKGGFVGVDVFFVLSGYLITSVVLHDLRTGEFSIRKFYLRRIQRLLPNAICMIVATTVLSYWLLLPLTAAKVAQHGLWTLLNLSNVYIWQSVGGYWGDSASSLPLLHTWSLAVEEQFYLIFPITLWFLARRRQSFLFIATSGLMLVSFALSVYGTWRLPAATFYLLPTRAWEPLLGAVLAIYQVPGVADRPFRNFYPKPAAESAGWLGLALISCGFLGITEGNDFPGWAALLPTCGAMAVIVSLADGTTRVARLLATPVMVSIGKLSYSLYLWHWPLMVIGRRYAELADGSQRVGELIGAALGVILSVVAYGLIEQPLRLRSREMSCRPRVFITCFSFCIAASLLVVLFRPATDRRGAFDSPVYHALRYNVVDSGPAPEAQWAARFSDVLFTAPDPHPAEIWKAGGIVRDWGRSPPRIVVLGSSHACMFGGLVDDICKELKVSVAFLTSDGVSAFFPTKVGRIFTTSERAQRFDDARRKWLREWKPDAVLVFERWDGCKPEELGRRLDALVQELEPYTQHLLFFSQVPALPIGETINLREFVTARLRLTGSLPRIPPDENETFRRTVNSEIEARARTHPKLQLIRTDSPFYFQDGSIKYSSGRAFFYIDNDHLSQAGTEVLRETCVRAISAACACPVANRDTDRDG